MLLIRIDTYKSMRNIDIKTIRIKKSLISLFWGEQLSLVMYGLWSHTFILSVLISNIAYDIDLAQMKYAQPVELIHNEGLLNLT